MNVHFHVWIPYFQWYPNGQLRRAHAGEGEQVLVTLDFYDSG